MWGTVIAASALPVLDDAELKLIDEEFASAGVRLVLGSVVDMAGVARAKSVPAARSAAFHRSGMGASPTWNVFCIDNGIAFTSRLGVAGDLRLRADLTARRLLGDGLAWAPAEFHRQDGALDPGCARGLLRGIQDSMPGRGLAALVGCELEFVLTHPDGTALPASSWQAYGLGSALDAEAFLTDLAGAFEAADLPLEQVHAEYGAGQYELSLAPAEPVAAADRVVAARLLVGRVARRHGRAVSLSPLPFAGGAGNGAHQHLSLTHHGAPLLSGGTGPHGLTGDGAAAVAGIVAGLPDLLAVLAGSVLSGPRLQPGHWAGAYACWGLENREAAVRLCAATPGNPHGASVELKCADPSANPYLVTAVLLGLALDGISRKAVLPPEVPGDPTDLSPAALAQAGAVPLTAGQPETLDRLARSPLAERLLGPDILDALLAVRRYEQDHYGQQDTAGLADRFRFAWSA
jgi:glutamine synthetase